MPEGPEILVIANVISRGIDKFFYDGEIIENTSKPHRFTNCPPQGWSKLQKGFAIRSVNTKGKLIWMDWELSDGEKIIVLNTLGMSGSWIWNQKYHKHIRLNFPCEDGQDLSFCDQRCFGTIRIIKPDSLSKILSKIGWDLLQKPAPDGLWLSFKNHYKIYNQPIGIALLDQSLFSGLGNIYQNELIYRVGIHPNTLVSVVPDDKWIQLNEIAHLILKEAYQVGGSSIDTFEADGKRGEAQKQHQIYGKILCPKNHKVSTVKLDGRTKWYCNTCQN